jgi:hypothetical protein
MTGEDRCLATPATRPYPNLSEAYRRLIEKGLEAEAVPLAPIGSLGFPDELRTVRGLPGPLRASRGLLGGLVFFLFFAVVVLRLIRTGGLGSRARRIISGPARPGPKDCA